MRGGILVEERLLARQQNKNLFRRRNSPGSPPRSDSRETQPSLFGSSCASFRGNFVDSGTRKLVKVHKRATCWDFRGIVNCWNAMEETNKWLLRSTHACAVVWPRLELLTTGRKAHRCPEKKECCVPSKKNPPARPYLFSLLSFPAVGSESGVKYWILKSGRSKKDGGGSESAQRRKREATGGRMGWRKKDKGPGRVSGGRNRRA